MKAGYVKRFSPVERLLHWVNALGFFFLLVTGLILYLPSLSELVSRRQTIQGLHFWAGVGWLAVLAAVVLRRRRAPQGRFNAGQKINAILTAAFTILFGVSGLLLWFGEQDTRFRFASTVILHDGLMYVSLALLVGHLYLALIHPATRHALRGMTLGDVRVEWAVKHHPKWQPEGVRVDWPRTRHHAPWKPELADADRSRRR